MNGSKDASGGREVVAKEPHCGVCQHQHFRGDWSRTPYCVKRGKTTEIRVGSHCSEFSVQSGFDGGRSDADVDAEIDWTDRTSGTEAPFYAAYRDEERYGWLCGNCRTLDVAIGPMKRFRCNQCGNSHRSSDWDAAYL